MNRASPLAKILFLIIIVLVNIGVDQVTKYIVKNSIDEYTREGILWDLVVLTYAHNEGAFLGMGSDLPDNIRPIVLSLLPSLMVVGVLIYLIIAFVVKKSLSTGPALALACALGGGVSNLIDRIFNGGRVFDFLNFGIGPVRTGIVNFADMSITFGFIIFAILIVRSDRAKGKRIAEDKSDSR